MNISPITTCAILILTTRANMLMGFKHLSITFGGPTLQVGEQNSINHHVPFKRQRYNKLVYRPWILYRHIINHKPSNSATETRPRNAIDWGPHFVTQCTAIFSILVPRRSPLYWIRFIHTVSVVWDAMKSFTAKKITTNHLSRKTITANPVIPLYYWSYWFITFHNDRLCNLRKLQRFINLK